MTEPIEARLQALAKEFQYPPTPSVADSVMSRLQGRTDRRPFVRKLTWALITMVILLAGSMSVPPVRAAVLEFIQIGIVRIFPGSAQSSPVPTTKTPMPTSARSALIPILEALGGETTLEGASSMVGFPIPLPTYPADLGGPDRVFVQDAGGWMVILVWLDAQQPDQVQMSLHMIEEGSWTIDKYHPDITMETTINHQWAIWTVGDYPLILRNGDARFTRMIDGHVLIWKENKVTYRLETSLEVDEAIRVAESLEPVP